MSLGIVATLAGATDPQAVQVGVSGLTAGMTFTVTGSTGTWTWTVPGGDGEVAVGTTAVLADILVPLAVAATYTVTQSGVSVSATPVTVPVAAACDVVVQSLDGQTVASAYWVDATVNLEQGPRVVTYAIPGRHSPLVRWDVATTDSGTMGLDASGDESATLRDLVAAGAPVIVRTNGQILDVDPVRVVIVTKAPRQMVGIFGTLRRWTISFQVIDFPDLSAALAASTWTDFDAAWSLLTGTDFDAYFAGLTGDQFDLIDWTTF